MEGLIFGILRCEVQNLEFFLWTNRYSHSYMQNFIRQGYNKCVCITKRLTRTLSFLKVWETFW